MNSVKDKVEMFSVCNTRNGRKSIEFLMCWAMQSDGVVTASYFVQAYHCALLKVQIQKTLLLCALFYLAAAVIGILFPIFWVVVVPFTIVGSLWILIGPHSSLLSNFRHIRIWKTHLRQVEDCFIQLNQLGVIPIGWDDRANDSNTDVSLADACDKRLSILAGQTVAHLPNIDVISDGRIAMRQIVDLMQKTGMISDPRDAYRKAFSDIK